MSKLPPILFAALFALPSYAADSYTIDPTHTWPTFEIDHLGYSIQRGRFNKSSGKIVLDIAAKKGSVDITIDANSLDMGFDKWNEHMKGADFFQVSEYPIIRYTSKTLLFDGDKVVGAEGEFTLMGETHPLALRVNNFKCAPHPMLRKMHCGANIAATIKRSQYGMSKYIPMIGDEVTLISPIEADID
ncbi:MAG: polyisoprenoid-binding protein [Nitrosomonadales bacterium]|nr:polyisoprenoid-binding protein [Nitrosomonadales bacterium]